ncbi:glycosyltransferase [Aestuariibius insulae]|uniref:glycosyltransferase family 2 protein n=1 Tax=Aestuariibius insulae TaxID=2058287 RepID=UPI00345E8DB4
MAGEISAIVPTFNRGAYLEEAIAAIASQTRPVSEIVIWDDGSTDDTPQRIADLEARFPTLVRAFTSKNGGKAKALNAALAQISGEYVWICDDDDVALPMATQTLMAGFDSSDVALVAGRHLRFRDDAKGNRKTYDTGYWPDLSSGSPLRHILEDIFFFQNGSLVRRQALQDAGPFREDLSRSIDYEMFLRLASRNPVRILEDVVFLQRKHDGARGPSSAQHTADQSDTVWKSHDLKIFRDVRETLPLSLYEALYQSTDPDLIHRAALLQRGTVYARRTDWDLALEDFTAAAALDPGRPLTSVETAITRRAMSGKHGIDEALQPVTLRKLKSLSGKGRTGTDILNALRRGALWHGRTAVQSRDLPRAISIASLAAPLLWSKNNAPDSDLTERQTLPLDVYGW